MNRSGPGIFQIITHVFSRSDSEKQETICNYSKFQGTDSNHNPTEYKSGVLAAIPRCELTRVQTRLISDMNGRPTVYLKTLFANW
jgi:hypothetical protein